ncbi:MAG: hypothetical protein ACRDD1_12835, partial [Planctomycetia bacterium]
KIEKWRSSATADPMLQSLPEGPIDPFLKTVAFYDGEKKLAALHYYATHPMSRYGNGMVSSDFAGLARKRRQADEPNVMHLYFTGCSGNIAAGKYNDGTPAARSALADRLYAGIVASEEKPQPTPIESVRWSTHLLLPELRDDFDSAKLEAVVADPKLSVVDRCRPAFNLAWRRRIEAGKPIVLSALHLGAVSILNLPAESFLEYQQRAQQAVPGRFVATAAYGDGGAWYIPTKEAYPQGGYEPSVAWSAPSIDDALTAGVEALLADATAAGKTG